VYWNLGVFLVLLENSWWDRFNRFFFTIFRVKVWKRMMFWMNFVVGNSDNLQKLGLEGKISWALNVFTLGPTTQATLISMDWKLTFWVLIMFNTWQHKNGPTITAHSKLQIAGALLKFGGRGNQLADLFTCQNK